MPDELLVAAAIEGIGIALRTLEEILEERPDDDPARQAAAQVRSAVVDAEAMALI